jgi:hypothetical protein
MTPKEIFEQSARQGIKILLDDCAYSQIQIVEKFGLLGTTTSRASISNLSREKDFGDKGLRNLSKGIQEILEREQCIVFDKDAGKYVIVEDCKKRPIGELSSEIKVAASKEELGYTIHNGRINVSDKVLFYEKAQKEIIELGLRLRNFTSYFTSKREGAFHDPIRQKLEEGVNFKCYVLNPTSSLAKRYFDDRAFKIPKEKETFTESPHVIRELKKTCKALNREGYSGKISLFQYDHFPYFHASVIDGEMETAKMYMSPYLYGVARANTPVIEIDKRLQKKLFKRYWDSVKAITTSTQMSQLV